MLLIPGYKRHRVPGQSDEPRVEENPRTEGDRVEKGLVNGLVSPPRSTEMP